jgi:hypothetical protein
VGDDSDYPCPGRTASEALTEWLMIMGLSDMEDAASKYNCMPDQIMAIAVRVQGQMLLPFGRKQLPRLAWHNSERNWVMTFAD